MEDSTGSVIHGLMEILTEISLISDYRVTVKKHYSNLSRRLKLLIPMFEEIQESKLTIDDDLTKALVCMKGALEMARDLLRFGSEGSKIYLALEKDHIMNKFHEVTVQLEQALSGISYDKLAISDEVKEQVELVIAQFRRAKVRVDVADEPYEDLTSLYKSNNADADPAFLRRVAEKLQLMGIDDIMQESLTLQEMIITSVGEPGEHVEKMSILLKKIKDFVLTELPDIDLLVLGISPPPASVTGQGSVTKNDPATVIPDDYRCPISLELMTDPVIVSTGQTYERSCIEKWLEAGHATCPKTQQTLSSTTLTPNYVLRSLIAQWCEAHGLEPPKRPKRSKSTKTSSCTLAERTKIESLLRQLVSVGPDDQRSAAAEIRLLAKRNADNRVAIADAGALPLLVGLLSVPDSRTQEHAVTALLNLSICEDNKGRIVSCGAVPGIVHILKKGSMEARENAAAALFSLSVVDENKVMIGGLGAIPPLVTLLNEGTQRGKKDAATALFNLCIYQGNKGKAVRAGAVTTLMQLMTDRAGGMVDEALAILAILASHSEAKAAIGMANALPALVDVIGTGSPRNRENATAVLVHVCSGDPQHIVEARELGIMISLTDLAENGTERGKRKAMQLLERMNRYLQARAQTEGKELSPVGPARLSRSVAMTNGVNSS